MEFYGILKGKMECENHNLKGKNNKIVMEYFTKNNKYDRSTF